MTQKKSNSDAFTENAANINCSQAKRLATLSKSILDIRSKLEDAQEDVKHQEQYGGGFLYLCEEEIDQLINQLKGLEFSLFDTEGAVCFDNYEKYISDSAKDVQEIKTKTDQIIKAIRSNQDILAVQQMHRERTNGIAKTDSAIGNEILSAKKLPEGPKRSKPSV